MRLFTKYFLFGMLVFGLALSVSGYFLLHYSMESSMAREADFALKQYQYDKFTVQSALLSYSDVSLVVETVGTVAEDAVFPDTLQFFAVSKSWLRGQGDRLDFITGDGESGDEGGSASGDGELGDEGGSVSGDGELEYGGGSISGEEVPENRDEIQSDFFVKSFFSVLAEEIGSPVAFCWDDGTVIYSEIEGLDSAFLEGLSEGAHAYQFRETPGGGAVLVGSVLNYDSFITADSAWSVTENGPESPGQEDAAEGQVKGGDAEADAAGAAGDTGAAAGTAGDTNAVAGATRDTDAAGAAGDTNAVTGTAGDTDAAGTAGDTNAAAWTAGDANAAAGAAGDIGTFRVTEKDIIDADAGIIAGTDLLGQSAGESRKICFVTQWDITKTVQQQEIMRQYFIRCYVAAMAAGMVLMGVLSALLTGPLKRMSKAAGRMAEGCYEERLSIHGKDEIGELAGSFNQMAAAVEEKIGELSRAAREKEDFVANFAHELKTPLTSIIGYADTIYQKELPREEVRRASWHIWNEGMRLEALSFKLMELIVLGRQDFPLVEMPADELIRDVADGLAPLLEEHCVILELETGQAYVRVDYDLLKTLLINLVDNSVKAGSSRVMLHGAVREGRYEITVRDNGCGMEEEVLTRITEAFYMVDKARSRKQHGAGLGLALADRIARIHGSDLKFESRKGEGTVVTFWLECSL